MVSEFPAFNPAKDIPKAEHIYKVKKSCCKKLQANDQLEMS